MDKKPFIIIGAIVVALIILYYVVSPYQNCKRNVPNLSPRGCMANTSW